MSKTEREVDSGWLNISAVERETGLSKDSLRVWERRYGFPIPARDEAGERIYPPDQVAKLRLLRQLIDRGRRPRAIAAMSQEELRGLLEESAGPDLARGDPDVDLLLRLLQGPQVA